LAVAVIAKKTSSGYDDHTIRITASRDSAAAGTAIISEKAMCMLGTAAYWLISSEAVLSSWATPVNVAIVSVNPASGTRRGGAVGNSA
jgi:hypothetical protein